MKLILKLTLKYTYSKIKLRLNLCLLNAYKNLNLNHNFKDLHLGILHYLDVFYFDFFNEDIVHSQKYLYCSKIKTVSNNHFTILLIDQF